MKCPHCLESFHEDQTRSSVSLGSDDEGLWVVVRYTCPTCKRFVLLLRNTKGQNANFGVQQVWINYSSETMFRPKGIARAAVPVEVPPEIAEDYKEACLVLGDSPKASAALSRRCLQNLLRRAAGVKAGDLSNEIQQVLDSGKLPSSIAENIDAVRHIGNFAAHPNKSRSTGEIVAVEPHEAEWNLEVLESVFDFYFVQPARARAKRDALNKKLADAGKQPIK